MGAEDVHMGKRKPEGTALLPGRRHRMGWGLGEQSRPAFQEAPEAAMGLPPVLTNCHAADCSTPCGPWVLKVCLPHRVHLIKNKVAHQEIHDDTSVCQTESWISTEASVATFS